MQALEIVKAILLGVIQGVTEWLPISSTGHMILFNSIWPLDPNLFSQDFIDMFFVVIQFGSILAVLVLYFHKLNPFSRNKTKRENKETFSLWGKVLVASIPAAIIGLLFDDLIHDWLYNAIVVAAMLIVYGIFFIVLENRHKTPTINSFATLDYKTAALIGIFQVLALIPGTSRSGATILGAVFIGASRYVATEFSFFLAIPVMFGASGLEMLKYFLEYGFGFSGLEMIVLLSGMIVAFFISIIAIKFLIKFIKTHDFKPFGYYRIILGMIVIIFFFIGWIQI